MQISKVELYFLYKPVMCSVAGMPDEETVALKSACMPRLILKYRSRRDGSVGVLRTPKHKKKSAMPSSIRTFKHCTVMKVSQHVLCGHPLELSTVIPKDAHRRCSHP